MFQNQEFVNGVYVNDAAGDLLDPAGAFRKFIGNPEGYWIMGDIWNSVWAIDEAAIQPMANPQQAPPPDTTTNVFTDEFNKVKAVIPKEYQEVWDKKLEWALSQVKSGKNMDEVMNTIIEAINSNMAFTHSSWVGKRIVKAGDKYELETYSNFDLWLNRRVLSLAKASGTTIPDGSVITAEINNLENNKHYAIVAIQSPDGTKTHGTLVEYGNHRFEYTPMSEEEGKNTYEAYMQLQESAKALGDILKPITPYLTSVIWKYTDSTKVDPVAATQWLSQNKHLLGNFTEVLNNYLEKRILANEC